MAKPKVTQYQLSKISCNEIIVQTYTLEGRMRKNTQYFIKVGRIKNQGNTIWWKERFNDNSKLLKTQELINYINYVMAKYDASKTPYVITILENQAWKNTYFSNWVWGNDGRTQIKFKPRFRTNDNKWIPFRAEW